MRSRLQDHIVDLNSPHLVLGAHNKDALHQTSGILGGIQDSAPERREVEGITIDGVNSLDLDDGVWIEKTARGGYRVQIHISDVSEYVSIFSPLDIEAFHRTTSIYRRDTVHNMFPSELANGTFSLDPSGGEKLTCTLQIDLDSSGNITDYQFFESRFTNLRRYDHESFGADYINPDSQHFLTLRLLNELSAKLRIKRILGGGMLHFGDDDRMLVLDNLNKRKENFSPASRLAHDIIESLMVLANVTVGNHLAKQPGVPSLFRRHDTVNERSFYHNKPCRHDGLKVKNYTHFTSPIRRYADLVIHRVMKALIRGDTPPYAHADIQFIASHANNVRLLVDIYGAQIDRESKGADFIQKTEARLGRQPLVSDLKTVIKNTTLHSHRLPHAIFQAISRNIISQPRDTWIWAVGVILLSPETELKKLLKDKILNHIGVRIRGFLNVLGQTRITLGEDPLFVVDENEQAGKYSIRIYCRGELISHNSCTIGGKNKQRDLPHQCRREAVEKLFDFFIDAA